MSTRARRSAGGLNPATIHLLPIARLKDELQSRGLDTNGSKEELAYRLEEHVQLGGGYKPFDPSPAMPTGDDQTKQGRGRKRKLEDITSDEQAEVIEMGNVEEPQKYKPFAFKWATAKPTAHDIPSNEVTSGKPEETEKPFVEIEELKMSKKIKQEKSPKKREKKQEEEVEKNTSLDGLSKLGTSEADKDGELAPAPSLPEEDEETRRKRKEEKRKRREEKRRRREEEEKQKMEAAKGKEKSEKKQFGTPKESRQTKEEAKLLKRKSVNLTVEAHLQKQQIFKSKEKAGILEKRRTTFAAGEETKHLKPSIASSSMATPKLKPSLTQHLTKNQKSSTPIQKQPPKAPSSRLDILDSILGEQEQLLARKKAQKAAVGAGEEEEVDEVLKLELERRQKRRQIGIVSAAFSSSSAGPPTTPSPSAQIGQQHRRMSASVGDATKTTHSTTKLAEVSPLSVSFKLPPPPPPPPPRKRTTSPKAPPIMAIQEEEHFRHRPSSSFSLPLIVDTRDPLCLSSVGPDTPPPPPPPARPPKLPSHGISIVLPPPPPPPPRRALVQQQQAQSLVQKPAQQQEGRMKSQAEKPIAAETKESVEDATAAVLFALAENVTKTVENKDTERPNMEKQFGELQIEFDKEAEEEEEGELRDTDTSEMNSVQVFSREIISEIDARKDEEKMVEESDEEESDSEKSSSSELDDEEGSITAEDATSSSEMDEQDEEKEEEMEAEESTEGDDDTPAELRDLLKDPKALLHKASDVLRKKFGADSSEREPHAHYEQVALSAEELKLEEDEEYRQLPDPEQFHGEPVPDDMDDDLFEIAAGLPLRDKKRDNEPEPILEEPLPNEEQIELDFYNSDLNMKASADNKWLIEPDNADGFALMWGAVRSNYGVVVPEQRDDMPPVAFQVKIAELLSLKHLPFEEPDAHDIRIGWSRAGTSNMMGESPHSFAFNSMANKATGNIFTDYGEPFELGDVITSVLDINCGEIRYFKNSQALGPAFTDIQFQNGDTYFPHVATKNCKMFVHFGVEPPEQPTQTITAADAGETINRQSNSWSMPADEVPEGTKWFGAMDFRLMSASKQPISDKAHCTIIAMVGLSGVGKTTWVRQYLKEHPEENWILLNTDTILQAMTINGVPRQRVHQGRWDMVMGLTAKALTRSLQMACRRRHNYILDQTNVTREARKKKLTQFQDFQRKCVVIIPSEAEHERRLIRQAREQGGMGQMPAEAMLEMKGNFSIPSTELEPVEDVIFIEPPIECVNEAIEQVRRYNEEGRPWVRQQQQRHGRHRGPPPSVISDHSNLPFVGTTRICV